MLMLNSELYRRMDISEIMINDWFRLYNISNDPESFVTQITSPSGFFRTSYANIKIDENILKNGEFDFFDRLRMIPLDYNILRENDFVYNDEKNSFDLVLYDGLIRVEFNSVNNPAISSFSPVLTIYLKQTKFHGTCYSVDKFQKITRFCGLINIANNFKVNRYD